MSESTSSPKSCPKCGAALPSVATAGLCPRCLMAEAMEATQIEAAPVTAQKSLAPEELAPHFPQLEILECLGRGGMGVVYKARQKSLNRFVALKLLAPERAGDPHFAARFEKEAHALATLNHTNIVGVYDFGQAGGFYFLLMEFVDGVNLRQAMKAGRFTPEQALAVVPPVCEALQYAHEHGIVHRDIKPENLLLDKEGRVKIADFGIAKMLGSEADAAVRDDKPQPGTLASVAGTPRYMAPEQKEHRRTDHRADIYSLGVVLYELLTGELPADKLQPPSRKVQIDVRLDEIVLRALEKTPELRYQTAGEFRTQVETVVATPSARPREEAQSSPAPTPLLKTASAYLSTPGWLASLRGKFTLYSGKGTLVLTCDQLVFTDARTGAPTTIPLAAIRDVSLGTYPWLAKPVPLNYVSVTWVEGGILRRHYFTPNGGWFMPVWATNPVVREWHEALRAAVTAATGKAPAETPAPPHRPTAADFVGVVLAFVLPVCLIAAVIFCFQQITDHQEPLWQSGWLLAAIFIGVAALGLPWFSHRLTRKDETSAGSSEAPAAPGTPDVGQLQTPADGLQAPRTGWGNLVGGFLGIAFTSPLAFKLANLSALGFLGFLGFVGLSGIDGLRWCQGFFGFSVFFGLIGVASMVEMAHRRKASTQGVPPEAHPIHQNRFLSPAFLTTATAIVAGTLCLVAESNPSSAGLKFLLMFLPYSLGPLLISLILSLLLLNRRSQKALVVGSLLYALWFAFIYLGAFYWNLDPQSAIALLFVGFYSLPVMIPVWLTALVFYFLDRRALRGGSPTEPRGHAVATPSSGAPENRSRWQGWDVWVIGLCLSTFGALWLLQLSDERLLQRSLYDGAGAGASVVLPSALATTILLAGAAFLWMLAKNIGAPASRAASGKRLLGRTIVPVIAVVVLLRTFFVQSFEAATDAAAPEIPRGSYMLTWKLAREFAPGDLVVYRHENRSNVGRVTGSDSAAVIVERNGSADFSVSRQNITGKVISVLWRASAPSGVTQFEIVPVGVTDNVVVVDVTTEVTRGNAELRAVLDGPELPTTKEADIGGKFSPPFTGTFVKPMHDRGKQPSRSLSPGRQSWRLGFVLPDAALAKDAFEDIRPVGALPAMADRTMAGTVFEVRDANGQEFHATLHVALPITPADPNWVSVSSAPSTPKASALSSYNESGGVSMKWEVLASQPGIASLHQSSGQSTASLKRDPKTKLYQTTVSLELTQAGADRVLLVSRIGGTAAREELPGNLRELSAELWSYRNQSATAVRGNEMELCRFQGKPITVQVPVMVMADTSAAPNSVTVSGQSKSSESSVALSWEVSASQSGLAQFSRAGSPILVLKHEPKGNRYGVSAALELTRLDAERILFIRRIGEHTLREEIAGNFRELADELLRTKTMSAKTVCGTTVELCQFQGKPFTVQVQTQGGPLKTTVFAPLEVVKWTSPEIFLLLVGIVVITLVVVLARKGVSAGKIVLLVIGVPLLLAALIFAVMIAVWSSMSQDPARPATAVQLPQPGQSSDNPGAVPLEKPLIDGSLPAARILVYAATGIEHGWVQIQARLDADHELAFFLGEEGSGWVHVVRFGEKGDYQFFIEKSDAIALEGGGKGRGFMIRSGPGGDSDGAKSTVYFAMEPSGTVPAGELTFRTRELNVTDNTTRITFANVVTPDGQRIPMTARVRPRTQAAPGAKSTELEMRANYRDRSVPAPVEVGAGVGRRAP